MVEAAAPVSDGLSIGGDGQPERFGKMDEKGQCAGTMTALRGVGDDMQEYQPLLCESDHEAHRAETTIARAGTVRCGVAMVAGFRRSKDACVVRPVRAGGRLRLWRGTR